MENKKSYERTIPLETALAKQSVLLLGPRRTGKSWLIRHHIKPDRVYNLLKSDTFQQLSARPSLIRESITESDRLIAIDEIQKLPILMDEVHLMIEEMSVKFLLTGSSARKLKRSYTSLMAGRAKTMHLYPFTSSELGPSFDLDRALRFGTLPPVYLAEDPEDTISSYVGDYLREEIQAEALTRKVENFSRFLTQAAIHNGELLNFESVASDAQVPARTIREYYRILEDTLIGSMLEPLKTSGKRKPVSHAKFYFFDVGVVNALTNTMDMQDTNPVYGNRFEHFIMTELRSYLSYFRPKKKLHFWRTQQGDEVDFVVDESIAIEAKSSRLVDERDLKGLKKLAQESPVERQIVVSRDRERRMLCGVEVIPYQEFLADLWAHKVVTE